MNAIVNRDDQLRQTPVWCFRMGDVKDIDLVSTQGDGNDALVDPGTTAFLVKLFEVPGQGAKFVKITAGS